MNIIKRLRRKRKLTQVNEDVCAAFGHYTFIAGKGEQPCSCRGKK